MEGNNIKQLIYELFDGKFTKDFTVEDILRILGQNNLYAFWEHDEDKVIGMTIMYIVELFSRKKAVIEEVVVLKKYRNRGVGSGLVIRAINKAKELGVTCVELTARNDRPEVKAFYTKLGFYNRHNDSLRLWINKN